MVQEAQGAPTKSEQSVTDVLRAFDQEWMAQYFERPPGSVKAKQMR
jgi:hypothetical protein